MPSLIGGGSVSFVIPTGQKVAVACYGGSCKISYGAGPLTLNEGPGNPPVLNTTIRDTTHVSAAVGPRTCYLDADAGTIVEYVVGVDPSLLNNWWGSLIDRSSTPGNVTIDGLRGRAAFAAAGTSVVVTNGLVTAGSTILVSQRSDATGSFIRAVPGAGIITFSVLTAFTAATTFDFVVLR